MPRIRFYNRRFVYRAPAETPSLETSRPPRADPQAALSRTLLVRGVSAVRSRKTPDHLSVIQPPTIAPLTGRDWLRFARHLGAFAGGGRTAAALSAVGRLCRANLWHPSMKRKGWPKPPVPLMGAHVHRCASTPPASASSRCLPPEKSPFGSRLRVTFVTAPPPLANGGGCRTDSSKLESFD